MRRKLLGVGVACAVVAVGAQAPEWREATPGRILTLPDDHVSHPEYKLEWWYYTGNLDGPDQRRFGYQLTFFRIGVNPAPAGGSRWAVRDLFMTHFALTDVTERRYRFRERLNRAGPGWAGSATDAYHVWNEEWSVTLEPSGVHHLRAESDEFGIDLLLQERDPPVLHGSDGFSRKGSAEGNASYYYSLTRLPTRGSIELDGHRFDVTGQSWMDHEFGTTFLEPNQVGWDWFSIQLDDGRDLMVFQLRCTDGSIDPRSSGTLVEPDRSIVRIARDAGFRLTPGRIWRSPLSGARYPVGWNVRIAQPAVDLAVTAAVDDQELRAGQSSGVTYWEGVIDVEGTVSGRPTAGRGYLEMTGYTGPSMGSLLR